MLPDCIHLPGTVLGVTLALVNAGARHCEVKHEQVKALELYCNPT